MLRRASTALGRAAACLQPVSLRAEAPAAAVATLCGVIHSPFPDGRLFLPWSVGVLPAEAAGRGPLVLAAAYALLAALFAAWSMFPSADHSPS